MQILLPYFDLIYRKKKIDFFRNMENFCPYFDKNIESIFREKCWEPYYDENKNSDKIEIINYL